ncbi:MAG: putative DNA-binding domain-containing protein, partial [Proteobacteria bacterium]|nr:putative DNA-binding domain-containing protein [Pseudomonadota bacterium]
EGVEDRRIGVYRELIYNNIEGFIADSFPVLRKITPDDRWHEMLRDYVCNHQAHTPLFPRMPLEFIQYLEDERHGHPEDPDFMLELAAYEWAEIAISLDTREIEMDGIDVEGDLLAGVPVLNPLIMTQTYQYPVHKISPDYLPDAPPEEPTYLLVYRRKDDEVGFLELNTVSARLIECIQANDDKMGLQLLERIAEELKHHDPQVVINGGHEIMRDMHDKDILLGVKA